MNELHLFAGAGGGILGGMLLGHTTVCAVEREPYCRKVLLQRQRDGILPKFPIWNDVCTFDGTPWRGKVDVVCGGFPCQDISAAGKGAGITGERSGLWGEMARIIGEIRPKYAFVENSPMLTLRGLDRVLGDLSEMGYDARWGVVGAIDAGAPHRRDRIWIVADGHGWGQQERRQQNGDTTQPKFKTSQRNDAGRCGENVSDAMCERSSAGLPEPEQRQEGNAGESFNESDECREICNTTIERLEIASRETEPLEQPGSQSESKRSDWWATEPALGRVAHGVANRVDRLKAIGNGQVPAVAALAWRTLQKGVVK